MNFARSLGRRFDVESRVDPVTRHEDEVGAPALRTAGLMLVQQQRADTLSKRFNANKTRNGQLESQLAGVAATASLHAQDLIRGYRIDIWDSVSRRGNRCAGAPRAMSWAMARSASTWRPRKRAPCVSPPHAPATRPPTPISFTCTRRWCRGAAGALPRVRRDGPSHRRHGGQVARRRTKPRRRPESSSSRRLHRSRDRCRGCGLDVRTGSGRGRSTLRAIRSFRRPTTLATSNHRPMPARICATSPSRRRWSRCGPYQGASSGRWKANR